MSNTDTKRQALIKKVIADYETIYGHPVSPKTHNYFNSLNLLELGELDDMHQDDLNK